jgi:hypothetical protein
VSIGAFVGSYTTYLERLAVIAAKDAAQREANTHPLSRERLLSLKARHPSKCASCGSREFIEHGGQTVCSYCRSTP